MKNIDITVKKNEERVVPFLWIDDKESEFTLTARLVGEGASLTIVGFFLGSSQHHVTFNTSVTHEAPHTKSLTTLRGVFKDRSYFANDGMVTIKKGAKGADGYFASKILLFDDAKGRSVPSLEIDENDLKAGHASTVGRPDPEQLFYLQSRGLSEKDAITLITAGFFNPLYNYLKEKDREQIMSKLKDHLGQ